MPLTLPSSATRLPAWAGGANQGFGSAGKDAIPGPNRVNFTTSLYKSFAFTEKARFEFRVGIVQHLQPHRAERSRKHARQLKLRNRNLVL